MSLTAEQLAAADAWLTAHAAAAQQIEDKARQAARATWLGFDAWYSAAAVAAIANETANLSFASQDVIVGAAQNFIANVVASLRGTRVTIPRTPALPPVRGESSPLSLVHSRPAETYKRAIATGKTHEEALNLALDRAESLQARDLSLAERAMSQALMEELDIIQFRRVVRPEVSKTGACGLCIAASDRIYDTAVLMPMHERCKCKTMPIVGDQDPGNSLNNLDLADLYDQAGSNRADDLKRTRYAVNEHGELGPVLTKEGDSFRDASRVRLEDDPARAARLLAQTIPVLAQMERDGAARGPLDYQRDLVARLTDIVADAA